MCGIVGMVDFHKNIKKEENHFLHANRVLKTL